MDIIFIAGGTMSFQWVAVEDLDKGECQSTGKLYRRPL
jgi:hypothetical protein